MNPFLNGKDSISSILPILSSIYFSTVAYSFVKEKSLVIYLFILLYFNIILSVQICSVLQIICY